MRSPKTHTTSIATLLFALSAPAAGCGCSGGGAAGGGESTTATPAAATEGPSAPRAAEPEPAPADPPAEGEESAEIAQVSPALLASRRWSGVLAAYRTDDGGFRYAALAGSEADRARLAEAVQAVADTRPTDLVSRDAQLAFYLNAYNILTVNAVLARFPIDSVMSVPGFFDAIEHDVMGTRMTLNALENDIIRGRFHEPRIHFAVNCASAGCPWLDATPFTAGELDATLTRLTNAFVGRTTTVDARRRRVVVSQLFEWFAGDFEPAGGVRAFLVAHTENEATRAGVADERNRITYFEYDWALNARP
ncbi:MAG: DUF547 domain-containing protein [Polyangiales bacterium]